MPGADESSDQVSVSREPTKKWEIYKNARFKWTYNVYV